MANRHDRRAGKFPGVGIEKIGLAQGAQEQYEATITALAQVSAECDRIGISKAVQIECFEGALKALKNA